MIIVDVIGRRPSRTSRLGANRTASKSSPDRVSWAIRRMPWKICAGKTPGSSSVCFTSSPLEKYCAKCTNSSCTGRPTCGFSSVTYIYISESTRSLFFKTGQNSRPFIFFASSIVRLVRCSFLWFPPATRFL